MKLITLIPFLVSLSSCAIQVAPIPDSDKYVYNGGLGSKSKINYEIPGKVKIKMEQDSVEGFKKALDIVKAMWNNYLMEKGLEFLAGKYYTNEGAIVSADKAVKLEELRNARSAAEASSHIKELEIISKTAP